MEKMFTVTLPSGASVSGTAEQLKTMLPLLGHPGLLGDDTHYFSESRGPVLIKEMETTHLRNAILKYYVAWVNDLHSINDPKKVCERLINGISDKCWLSMVREYSTRGV